MNTVIETAGIEVTEQPSDLENLHQMATSMNNFPVQSSFPLVAFASP